MIAYMAVHLPSRKVYVDSGEESCREYMPITEDSMNRISNLAEEYSKSGDAKVRYYGEEGFAIWRNEYYQLCAGV